MKKLIKEQIDAIRDEKLFELFFKTTFPEWEPKLVIKNMSILFNVTNSVKQYEWMKRYFIKMSETHDFLEIHFKMEVYGASLWPIPEAYEYCAVDKQIIDHCPRNHNYLSIQCLMRDARFIDFVENNFSLLPSEIQSVKIEGLQQFLSNKGIKPRGRRP